MNKEILKNILKLDSIYKLLDWEDRIIIHLLLQYKIETSSQNITILYDWLQKGRWLPPIIRYGQDRLLYVEHESGDKILVEEYRKHTKLRDLPI